MFYMGWGVSFSQADTLTLNGGVSLTGDVLRFDDEGLMLKLPDDTYTNLAWSQISQDSLKSLDQNPKIARFVDPFIEPTAPDHPIESHVVVKPVQRMVRPADPSILMGLLHSGVGVFVLLVVYLANLYAGYEVAVFRLRSPGQVIGLAAILPVIGPAIFLAKGEAPPREAVAAPSEAVMAPSGSMENPQAEIAVVDEAHKVEEKKLEPQIYPRGKFTFNKRFVETKFGGFIGEPKGDALKFSMELKSSKEVLAVEKISQVAATEVILEVAQRGLVTVALVDILEVKLIPKPV